MINNLLCSCGSKFRCKVGDTIQSGVYRWYMSSYCESCGRAIEMDGIGVEDIPADVQQEMIKEYGEWEIIVKNQISKAVYLMKKVFGSYEIDSNKGDTHIIYRGTKNQVLFIKNLLMGKGMPELDMEIKRSGVKV